MQEDKQYEFYAKLSYRYHELWQDCFFYLPNTQSYIDEILDNFKVNDDYFITLIESRECYLEYFLSEFSNIYTLNLLAEKLSKMNYDERRCFQGITTKAYEIKGEERITLNEILNMADSANKCEYIPGIKDNEELAKFYYNKGLYSEIFEKTPNDLKDSIPFKEIGEEVKKNESGIYISSGYVKLTQNIEQKYSKSFIPELKQMKGTVLLSVSYKNMEQTEKTTELSLPASKEDVANILNKLGTNTLENCTIQLQDSIAPSMIPMIEIELNKGTNIKEINEFAFNMERFQKNGELNKYKAIIKGNADNSIAAANAIAGQIDNFYYINENINLIDYAKTFLKKRVPEIYHQLFNIDYHELAWMGEELLQLHAIANTEFGAFVKKEGEAFELFKKTEEAQKLKWEKYSKEIMAEETETITFKC